MRVSRKFVDLPLATGQTVRLPAQHLNYLARVLRLRKGDSLILFNGRDGRDYRCRLESLSKQEICAKVLEQGEQEQAPSLYIHLAIGISRSERMDFALQKAVELGVDHISPLLTENSVVRLDDKRLQRKMGHWQGVIASACEQSGRRIVPRLDTPCNLARWLDEKPIESLIFDHRASEKLTELMAPEATLGIMVGPEGGWADFERKTAINSGCRAVSLGPRVLRTETMPLAAIAAAQTLWGDFR